MATTVPRCQEYFLLKKYLALGSILKKILKSRLFAWMIRLRDSQCGKMLWGLTERRQSKISMRRLRELPTTRL